MAKKAKKSNGRRKYTRRPKENVQEVYSPGPVLMQMMAEATANQSRNVARSSDARSEVLGALAGVLSDVTTAVQALGSIANTAPNYSNTETRQ